MGIHLVLNYWLYLPKVWIILALLLLALEMTDGSAFFFLPLSISALCVAAIVFATGRGLIPFWLTPNAWYWLLAWWIGIAIVVSYVLARRRKGSASEVDINKY